MLHNFIKKAEAIALAAMMSCMFILPSSASAQTTKDVMIKAGTPIEVATTNDISSKHHPVGTIVDLKLLNPVSVKNEVVIPAGTIIKGKVTQCQKSKLFGGKGSIAIEANTITAIDGTLVPISGISFRAEGKSALGWSIVGTVCCLFGFLIHGTQGVIPAGTQMSGNVMANTTVAITTEAGE